MEVDIFEVFMFFSLFGIIFSSCADDPHNDPDVAGDPYKTLFVARLVSANVPLVINFHILYMFCLDAD